MKLCFITGATLCGNDVLIIHSAAFPEAVWRINTGGKKRK
jgi:hypothetical protein